MRIITCFLFGFMAHAQGVLIDRVAIVVGQSIIKDSDIDREVRVTEFLNDAPLHIDSAERKQAAAKLIDQVFLRNEIRAGSYPYATEQKSQAQLNAIVSERFHTLAAFRLALSRYGLDEQTVLAQFRWQLTVLGFIDERFKPAVVVPDSEVDNYYRIHFTSLRKRDPKGSADDLRSQSRDILTEDKVNQIFFAWLDEHRKNSKISYHEEGLT